MPVEQHPVPQNISSYEFRLVGDMTLRQFATLASGVVVAIVFYSLPLPGFIKWPLVAISAFLGFAFAFMPIEERPLSMWLVAFIKSIFSPTLFTWRKTSQKLAIFEPTVVPKVAKAKITSYEADKSQLTSFLKTVPQDQVSSKVDLQETSFLNQISGLFQGGSPTTFTPSPSFTPSVPKEPVIEKPIIQVPKNIPPPEKKAVPIPSIFKTVVIPTQEDYKKGPVYAAKMGIDLPIPIQPTRPNILSGMVFDKYGKMLEGTILEIRDQQGMPVRAFKTNKLGQFIIATPLEKGVYEIEIEKEGYQFDIIKIEAKGEIIKPIEIRAK